MLKFNPIMWFLAGLGVATGGSVYAGGESSGGGNGVVCFDHPAIAAQVNASGGIIRNGDLSHITSIEMVDLFQARKPRGIPAKTPEVISIDEDPSISDSSAILGYLKKLQSRFQYAVPEIAQNLERMQEFLSDDFIVLHDSPLKQMHDADLEIEIDTENCALSTLAFSEIISPEVVYVHLDRRLFDLANGTAKHSRLSKAVLMMHEYFYLLSRFFNHETTSKKTRDMMGYIITQRTGVSLDRTIRVMAGLGFGPRPDSSFLFSDHGAGLQWEDEYAAYPYYVAFDFLDKGFTNIVYLAYIDFNNSLNAGNNANAVLLMSARQFLNKYDLNEFPTYTLDGVIAYFELLFGQRHLDKPLKKTIPSGSIAEAVRLFAQMQQIQTARKAAILEALMNLFDQVYAANIEAIPYMSVDEKASFVKAMKDSAEAMAEGSRRIKLITDADGKRSFVNELDSAADQPWGKSLLSSLVNSSRWNFIDDILRRELPLAQ
jgi:hypothetical protein